MTDYVAAGYCALAAILGLYAVRLRRRGRVLARALPPPLPTAPPASDGPS